MSSRVDIRNIKDQLLIQNGKIPILMVYLPGLDTHLQGSKLTLLARLAKNSGASFIALDYQFRKWYRARFYEAYRRIV